MGLICFILHLCPSWQLKSLLTTRGRHEEKRLKQTKNREIKKKKKKFPSFLILFLSFPFEKPFTKLFPYTLGYLKII